jgi:histidine triad (HIT) family protein
VSPAGDPDCLFCKIVSGEIPSTRIYEDDQTVAFMDIFPWTTGHCLVVPREHFSTIFELPQQAALAVMATAHRLAGAIRAALRLDGLNLLQSNGRAAWQTVDHFHVHLIPRYRGDGLVPLASPKAGDQKSIGDTAEAIRGALAP